MWFKKGYSNISWCQATLHKYKPKDNSISKYISFFLANWIYPCLMCVCITHLPKVLNKENFIVLLCVVFGGSFFTPQNLKYSLYWVVIYILWNLFGYAHSGDQNEQKEFLQSLRFVKDALSLFKEKFCIFFGVYNFMTFIIWEKLNIIWWWV